MTIKEEKQIVYKWCHSYDTFSFALKDMAERHDKIHRAVYETKTWGELKEEIHPDDFEYLVEWYEENEMLEEGVKGTDKINWSFVDNIYNVYYPGWLFTYMPEFIPIEILKKYGVLKNLEADDEYYEISPLNLVPFITELEKLGFKVEIAGELEFDP